MHFDPCTEADHLAKKSVVAENAGVEIAAVVVVALLHWCSPVFVAGTVAAAVVEKGGYFRNSLRRGDL